MLLLTVLQTRRLQKSGSICSVMSSEGDGDIFGPAGEILLIDDDHVAEKGLQSCSIQLNIDTKHDAL